MTSEDFTFSRLLSYILHPLIIPTFATTILMFRQDLFPIVLPLPLILWFVGLIFVLTFVLPAIGVLILLKFNAVNSVQMNQRTERTVPLLISSASYMALIWFLRPSNVPAVFLYVVYSATMALLAGLLINMVYKISLHTLGWSALTATFISISIRTGMPLVSIICYTAIIAGFAGYARLKENAHNPTQVYLGYAAGAVMVLLISLLA
jgi:hypothetical protein